MGGFIVITLEGPELNGNFSPAGFTPPPKCPEPDDGHMQLTTSVQLHDGGTIGRL